MNKQILCIGKISNGQATVVTAKEIAMNAAQEFAKRLGEKYGVEVEDKLPLLADMPDSDPAYKIVEIVLPPPLAIEWVQEQAAEIRQLRQQFGFEPFDKFDAATDELIAGLRERM